MADVVLLRARVRSATSGSMPMRPAGPVRRVVARFVERPRLRAVRVAAAVRGQVRQWRELGGHQEHAE